MKILVFSDTHGRTEKMRSVILANKFDTELVIHLGDCFTDLAEIRNGFPEIAFLGVSGNCDRVFSEDYPLSSSITLEGVTLFFTHGHQYSVSGSLSALTFAAKSKKASVALFGHTHVPLIDEQNGVMLFNPGSLERPRDGLPGAYGIIILRKGKKPVFEIKRVKDD